MSLQVASTASVLGQAPTSSLRVEVNDLPTDAWFEVWHAVHGHGGDTRSEWEMLDRVDRPCAYACARNVLAVLADWVGGNAAGRMYLQVERDNTPALRLYERTGFSEVCGYHYRAAA